MGYQERPKDQESKNYITIIGLYNHYIIVIRPLLTQFLIWSLLIKNWGHLQWFASKVPEILLKFEQGLLRPKVLARWFSSWTGNLVSCGQSGGVSIKGRPFKRIAVVDASMGLITCSWRTLSHGNSCCGEIISRPEIPIRIGNAFFILFHSNSPLPCFMTSVFVRMQLSSQ